MCQLLVWFDAKKPVDQQISDLNAETMDALADSSVNPNRFDAIASKFLDLRHYLEQLSVTDQKIKNVNSMLSNFIEQHADFLGRYAQGLRLHDTAILADAEKRNENAMAYFEDYAGEVRKISNECQIELNKLAK